MYKKKEQVLLMQKQEESPLPPEQKRQKGLCHFSEYLWHPGQNLVYFKQREAHKALLSLIYRSKRPLKEYKTGKRITLIITSSLLAVQPSGGVLA